jgi:hypothetical protein
MNPPAIKVDKGVPIPLDGRTPFYPWKVPEVGDSFLFPKDRSLLSCRSVAHANGKKLNRRFMVRETPEGNRCWRIEDRES